MTRLALLILITSGCTLYFNGDDKPPTCQPDSTTMQLVDPATLQCDTFSEPTGCPPGCACPPIAGIVAQPTWGACSSDCRALDETGCLASSSCRVARDWAVYYSSSGDSFLGCYPLDDVGDHTNPATCEGRDAQSCSSNAGCTALYQQLLTDCASCADAFQFQECIPATQKAGSCFGAVACDQTVTCPAGTTPGVDGICYTGSCIPDQFCPAPPPT